MEVYAKKILVVDYEKKTRELISKRLTSLGYTVFLESNGEAALLTFLKELPDLVILDILLPKIDGYELCHKIRENSQIPIIILTALNDRADCIIGLNFGADDYIIKPFLPKELEARIRSVLRRSSNSRLTSQHQSKNKQKLFKFGSFVVDFNRQQVFKNNLKVNLTNLEYSLLELLVTNAGISLSRKTILDNIWGYTPERYVDTRVVDVHISRLRAKLEIEPANPDLIMTVRGIGYKFQNYS